MIETGNYIKGKFAESLCRLHFLAMGYQVDPLGIEHIAPSYTAFFSQGGGESASWKEFREKRFAAMPDFIMSRTSRWYKKQQVSEKDVFLVEVKYKGDLCKAFILPKAKFEEWEPKSKGDAYRIGIPGKDKFFWRPKKFVNEEGENKIIRFPFDYSPSKSPKDEEIKDYAQLVSLMNDSEEVKESNPEVEEEYWNQYKHHLEQVPFILFYLVTPLFNEKVRILFLESNGKEAWRSEWYSMESLKEKQQEKEARILKKYELSLFAATTTGHLDFYEAYSNIIEPVLTSGWNHEKVTSSFDKLDKADKERAT